MYGDASFRASAGDCVEALAERVAAARDVAALRVVLALSGQLEQGIEDGALGLLRGPARALTDRAAAAFHAVWSSDQRRPEVELRLAVPILRALARLAARERAVLEIRVPEGFAHYAVLPESYFAAARRFAAEVARRPGSGRSAAVIGVRTIGTSLSAAVGAALRAHGWRVARSTVRPGGAPFSREVELEDAALAGASWVLVVDEGPGLSGTSMSAVADAALRRGAPREAIVFFPGHTGDPGPEAPPHSRTWWSSAPRYVGSPSAAGLAGELMAATSTLAGAPAQVMEDASGGRWRAMAWPDEEGWPSVHPAFDRPKRLISTLEGGRWLGKWAGFVWLDGQVTETSSERAIREIIGAQRSGAGSMRAAEAGGFVIRPWVEGVPLDRRSTSLRALDRVAEYHAGGRAGRAHLGASERAAAVERAWDLVTINGRELLAREEARAFSRASARARAGVRADPDLSTRAIDGRPAPHEWIAASSGHLVKVSITSHEVDHLYPGAQPDCWELAGVIVEWDLRGEARQAFLDRLAKNGLRRSSAALLFFRAAYAAFRAGVVDAALHAGPLDSRERARLERDRTFYLAAMEEVTADDGHAEAPDPRC